jgi:hypothetical protein
MYCYIKFLTQRKAIVKCGEYKEFKRRRQETEYRSQEGEQKPIGKINDQEAITAYCLPSTANSPVS